MLAVQAERRMSELGLSTTTLAARMHTSRNQILRILDKEDAGITLKMPQTPNGGEAGEGCEREGWGRDA